MPTYTYTTKAATGEFQVVADNLPAAVRWLRDNGVKPTSVGEPVADTATRSVLGEADLCLFLRQLASMLDSGTPMLQALRMLSEEARVRGLQQTVSALADDVAEGIPLSASMAARPQAFGPVVTALVRAGEASGDLPGTLRQIAEQREEISSVARRSAALLVYPCFVGFFALALVTFLLTFIVPKFISLFEELGIQEFPLPTLILMRAANGFGAFAWAFFAALAVAVVLFVFRRRLSRGRVIADYWRLGAPIVGRLNLHLCLARVTGALGLMLEHGVPVVEALRLAGEAAGNGIVAAAFRRGERAVSEGLPLADGLREAGVLPESFVWRVSVGEESGAFAESFRRMAQYYLETAHSAARALQGVIEPILVVLLGLLVGSIVVGLFLPLVSIVSSLSSS
ncbi:MAG: type II secretion system F family protein [Armatimonadetes bacterium]|nr:type II secretion system F family protein [Armatimonadota bacterium]